MAKIAYSTLIQGIEKGELIELVHLELKVKSFSITWVKRFTNLSMGKWKALPRIFYNTRNLKLFFSSNSPRIANVEGPQFYKVIQNNWSDITKVDTPNENIVYSQMLWNNRYITIQKKPFEWRRWKEAGILRIYDITRNEGMFLDGNEIFQKYGIRVNFLELLQVRQSIPFEWRRKIENSAYTCNVDGPFFSYKGRIIEMNNTNSKTAYLFFRDSINKPPTCINKWRQVFPHINETSIKDIFLRPFLTTKETKLQSFQYQILHRYIYCRKKLHEMTLVDDPNCEHCGALDTLSHFFVDCPYVSQFWINLQEWVNSVYTEIDPLSFTTENIIFGMDGVTDYTQVINYISLIAKYFINTNRLKSTHTLEMRTFFSMLKYKLRIEKHISMKNQNSNFDKYSKVFEAI